MDTQKLARNLIAGLVIILLLIVAAVIIIFVPRQSSDSLRVWFFDNLEFKYLEGDYVEGSDPILHELCYPEDDIDLARGTKCLTTVPRPNQVAIGAILLNKVTQSRGELECLGAVTRSEDMIDSELGQTEQLNASIRESRLPSGNNPLTRYGSDQTEIRIFVDEGCYQARLRVKQRNQDVSPTLAETRMSFVYDQLLDITRSLSLSDSDANTATNNLRLYRELIQQEIESNDELEFSRSNGDNDLVDSNEFDRGAFEGPRYSIGETVFESDLTKVVFQDILEDSRCPTEVLCVQAGRTLIEFSVLDKVTNNESAVQVVTGQDLQVDKADMGSSKSITLISVLPSRTLSSEIPKSNYQVQVLINDKVSMPQAPSCVRGGCSGQLCVSAEDVDSAITTCEYRAEYACYQAATCEVQATGECGFTKTDELNSCLANPPALTD